MTHKYKNIRSQLEDEAFPEVQEELEGRNPELFFSPGLLKIKNMVKALEMEIEERKKYSIQERIQR